MESAQINSDENIILKDDFNRVNRVEPLSYNLVVCFIGYCCLNYCLSFLNSSV